MYCKEESVIGAGATLSDFESGLVTAGQTFQRWTLRCMAACGMKDMNIDAVFSTEPLRFPKSGDACAVDADENIGIAGLNCAGFGSAMVVTAAQVLRNLANGLRLRHQHNAISSSET